MAKERFLLFADFLGTKEVYSSSIDDVTKRRELLEMTLEAYVLPLLESSNIYLYVFSDTAVITCPAIAPLFDVAAKMFRRFADATVGHEEAVRPETTLLRGAICRGREAHSKVLTNSERITVIPMLDSGLPKAANLERIRKGSRLFVDAPDLQPQAEQFNLYYWRFITGKGETKPDLFEFLWPQRAYELGELLATTEKVRRLWLRHLKGVAWDTPSYDAGVMLHLDETVKLFVRSLPAQRNDTVRRYLLDILPNGDDQVTNVEYEWGVWFQSLKALCEASSECVGELRKKVVSVRETLKRQHYWEHFQTELEKTDYSHFKKVLKVSGVI